MLLSNITDYRFKFLKTCVVDGFPLEELDLSKRIKTHKQPQTIMLLSNITDYRFKF